MNFFRYTFTKRVVAKGLVLSLSVGFGVMGALRMHWWFVGTFLAIVYGIFCALFLFLHYKYWIKYKHF